MTSETDQRSVSTGVKIVPLCLASLLLWGCPGTESSKGDDGSSPAVGGFRAVVDPETGELTSDPAVTPTSSYELILREDSLNTSDAGLFEEELPDGTVMLDPQGRYRSALRVRIVDEAEDSTSGGEE